MSSAPPDKNLSTADLAAAARTPDAPRDGAPAADDAVDISRPDANREDERLAALFPPNVAQDFRSRWDAVQIGFVDDPRQAVRSADELVAQVMKSLAETFADERTKFEGDMEATGNASTENLRVALRRYRSFFQRLLSL